MTKTSRTVLFIINNEYQALQVLNHKHEFEQEKIEIKFILLTMRDSDFFADLIKNNYVTKKFKSPAIKSNFIRLIQYVEIYLWARLFFKGNVPQALVFFSELDIRNHIIVRFAKKSSIPIYIFEDGGLPSYLILNKNFYGGILPAKEFLKKTIFSLILNSSGNYIKLNNQLFLVLDDDVINGFISYEKLAIFRNFNLFVVNRPIFRLEEPDTSKFLFLSEPLFEEYCSFDDYICIQIKTMRRLNQIFGKILFKFHPREDARTREKVIFHFWEANIEFEICPYKGPAEQYILNYKPHIVASYLAATLITFRSSEIKILYIFQMVDKLFCQVLFKEAFEVLSEINYIFALSDENLMSGAFGFRQVEKNDSYSIGALLVNEQTQT